MDTPEQLLDVAEAVLRRARALGADEVAVTVSRGTQTSLERRDGALDTATESTTRGLTLSVLRDDRFTSNATSDLRPAALDAFIRKAVEATEYLEPDPARRLPDGALCGRGVSEATLDQDDPAWATRTAEMRAAQAEAIERHLLDRGRADLVSVATSVADGRAESVRVMSNGFVGIDAGAWFSAGGDMTLKEGERRPESGAWYGARYLSDLPDPAAIAAEVEARVVERLGSGPAASGAYTMVLANRAAGKILGVLGGPLSGSSLHEHRSCLEGKLDQPIGSELFTLIDDPTLPRGLGSRPWDGDALRAAPRTIVEGGVLRQFNIGVYYGRKLGVAPTSAGRSNWIVPAGAVATRDILAAIPKAILVTGFLGGNSNSTTGDFSFGIRGTMLEGGVPVASLSEMNVSGNALDIFHRLVAVGDDPWAWSSARCPTLVFDGVQFSGT